ncbi:50S ribosomal protein L24 [Candidatus Pacearchaeota archaeon]|nr:50S ribosomal protein L24 [Candidatus Pacearchaeota archaeon]
MKTLFSTSWKSSKQPRKQRKYRYEAPLHIRHKFLSASLSKDLRKKYEIRSLPVRTGDEVIVMRGKFTKKKSKILKVNVKTSKVTIEGITRKKADGTKINVYFDPSNLQIVALKLDDLRRIAQKRKNGESKKSEEKTNAPDKK